jgi:hypothetical protein
MVPLKIGNKQEFFNFFQASAKEKQGVCQPLLPHFDLHAGTKVNWKMDFYSFTDKCNRQ